MTAMLEIDGLGKRFGGFVALDGISLSVRAGERVGLIGPNGSGKTTLLNLVSGFLRLDDGTVSLGNTCPWCVTVHGTMVSGLSGGLVLADRPAEAIACCKR